MRRVRLLMTLLLVGAAPLLPLCADDDEEAVGKRELAKFSPGYLAQLRKKADAFLQLPRARQDQLVKLSHELGKENSYTQKRLLEVMHRYHNWLERLPEEQRRRIAETANPAQRLQLVRAIREQQWLKAQPKAHQQLVARLEAVTPPLVAAQTVARLAGPPAAAGGLAAYLAAQPTPAAAAVAWLREDEEKRLTDWQIAARHWDDLLSPAKEMPTAAIHFGKEVDFYVTYYLKPMLSKDELERLRRTEGHWPDYPYTLVELADRHPPALQGPQGLDAVAKLPPGVRERLIASLPPTKPGTKVGSKALTGYFAKLNAEGRWPQFGSAAAELAHGKGPPIPLPYELWPVRKGNLYFPMQEFVDRKLLPRLTFPEKGELKAKEGKWPDYPHKIQELSVKYHLQPPWQTLPKPVQGNWDAYRPKQQVNLEGYPEVPKFLLRDFAMQELSPQERAALNLSAADPLSWQRLTEKYFQERPGELKRLQQADHQFMRHQPGPFPPQKGPPHKFGPKFGK